MSHSNQGRHRSVMGLYWQFGLIAACSSPVIPDEGQSFPAALVVQGRNFSSGWEDAFLSGNRQRLGNHPYGVGG
jgi:hypothetical protein